MDIILALETTEKFGSVALLEGHTLLEEIRLPHDQRSAQTLAPTMDRLLRKHSIEPKNVAVIAVVTGPGSFTGLRTGVTAAKMFTWAVGAEIVGLGTDSVVAEGFLTFQMPGLFTGIVDRPFFAFQSRDELPPFLTVGIDAQRGEVCARVFELETTDQRFQYHAITTSELIPIADWWKQTGRWKNLCFTGPALERYSRIVPENVIVADESLWSPRAAIAGDLAVSTNWTTQKFDDLLSLAPIYSRLSAAEERRFKIGG